MKGRKTLPRLLDRLPRRRRAPIADDPRWRRLQEAEWTCSCCAEPHRGIPDLACHAPAPWTGGEEKAPNADVVRSRHVLTEDFCVVEEEDFFVRCVLELPIIGSGGEVFAYGVWSSLSRPNFERYVETFDGGAQEGLGPWFGWFSNRLAGYPDTLLLKCQVHPRGARRRPWIELEPTDHPLAVEQRDGITVDRLLEICAIHGHDFRPSILD